jgi:small subunit ribosomal protein S21
VKHKQKTIFANILGIWYSLASKIHFQYIYKRGFLSVYVAVRENNVDQALRVLKKKMQREGMFREMKNRRNFEKPSERRAREAAESTRRVRKLMRKRMEREGY